MCDDQWHHYAVNVRFPDVELFVDGQIFRSEKKNPEVIDDWPLHPTKGINTTLTVGACWQVRLLLLLLFFYSCAMNKNVKKRKRERNERKCEKERDIERKTLQTLTFYLEIEYTRSRGKKNSIKYRSILRYSTLPKGLEKKSIFSRSTCS